MNRYFRALPLAFLSMSLASCGPNGAPEPTSSASTSAETSASPTKPALSLSGGKLVLPAVKGNPGAAYFTLTNGTAGPVTVASIEVAGAGMTMLHETVEKGGHSTMTMLDSPHVKPGETLKLAPGGKHLMVDAVPDSAKVGGTIELTITFTDGHKLSAPLAIVGPGGAD